MEAALVGGFSNVCVWPQLVISSGKPGGAVAFGAGPFAPEAGSVAVLPQPASSVAHTARTAAVV